MMFLHLLLLSFIPRNILGHLNPAAASLLRQLNPAIDPCEDFYGFVCDKYIRNNVVPDDDVVKSWRTDIRDLKIRVLARLLSKPIKRRESSAIRKAKLYYRSCMCVDEIEAHSVSKALKYLNTTGGSWPTFDPNWDENDFDLETSLAAAALQDGYDTSGTVLGPFIQFLVTRDHLKPRPYTIMRVARPDFLLRAIDLSPENLAEFESLIIDSLRLLGADDATAEADGRAIFQFEMAMQAIPEGILHTTNVSEVQFTFPYIDWHKYLNGVLKQIGKTVKGDDPIAVSGYTFFEQFGSVLASTSSRTIANDIKWRMFQHLLPAMPDSIRERFLRIETILTGVKSISKRQKHCVLNTNSESNYRKASYGMGLAVARMYVQTAFSRYDKYKAEAIGSEVKALVTDAIEDATWLSGDTKRILKRKLDEMVTEHIFQEDTISCRYLDNFYRDVRIKRRGFVENFISTAQGIVRRNLEELDNPIENQWLLHPSVSTALYYTLLNQYTVSAQYLYPDGLNFDQRNPMVINYATAGYVSGHEVMHGVWRNGCLCDGQGKFVGDIYSAESWDAFREREMCIIEQYSEYDVPFTNGTKVNGALKATENIPDNIGVKFSFLAYGNFVKKHGEEIFTRFPFTPRQLFFLIYTWKRCEIRRPKSAERRAATAPHSPGKWRANGPLRNFPEFAEQFRCPIGSFMNPVDSDRCPIL